MSTIPKADIDQLVRFVQGNNLLVRHLNALCVAFNVGRAGVKADLQRRIVNIIQEAINTNDTQRFYRIQKQVYSQLGWTPPTPALPSGGLYLGGHASSVPVMPNYNPNYNVQTYNSHRPHVSHDLTYKSSPFYEVRSRLGNIRQCDVMNQHRNSITIPLKVQDSPELEQCVSDKSYRVMVFCAGDNSGVQDIAFPHQSEIKVNGDDIKANLRGLKNKPGSTRPADITKFLRLRPNYTNNVDFTYALTNKRFYLSVHICKVTAVEDLVARIAANPRIQKASVIREITKTAQDSEIETTSQVLSLKCPVSYTRLQTPCRSLHCSHIQCFDATSYLQLQEQGPQWLCPICSKPAPFQQLAVDEYVKDILANTSQSLDQVTIEPDGRWQAQTQAREERETSNGPSIADDEDWVIADVSEVRPFATPSRSIQSTTVSSVVASREGSSMPRGPGTTSAKRPAPAVIDLTISSDEDDEPIARPAKRQHLGYNGFVGPRGTGIYQQHSYLDGPM